VTGGTVIRSTGIFTQATGASMGTSTHTTRMIVAGTSGLRWRFD
jgi:hypothetical protein